MRCTAASAFEQQCQGRRNQGADPLLLHFGNHLSLRQGQIDHLITAYPPGISDLPTALIQVLFPTQDNL